MAGVVYLLGRLTRYGFTEPMVGERVVRAAGWLLGPEGAGAADEGLPGLHFGDAGVALALAEAVRAGLLDAGIVRPVVLRFLSHPPDWPDITHGAAWQGVAALACADLLRDSTLAELARPFAEWLMESQQPGGSWTMPEGVEGMSGETLTGFAHGVAGMVYFLAEYARRTGHARPEAAWRAGADWLLGQANPTADGRLGWRYGDAHPTVWKWWCHGGPGIALTFLRVFEQTGERSFDAARRALPAHPARVRAANHTQCHGLSGLGEIYLEAWRVLGEAVWHERALEIADVLSHLSRESSETSLTWLVEDPYLASADLMVGGGGVVHFLLRLAVESHELGFPLLLPPLGPD